VADLVRAHFRSQFPEAGRDQPEHEGALQFVVGGCMALLIWWLDNDIPYSAGEIHTIFRRLAMQGVTRLLAT
jgi:hypothetical protein